MKRYELILMTLMIAAMCFWTGYRCGQDSAQLAWEARLDAAEIETCYTDMECQQMYGEEIKLSK